jgi:RNA polymerase sigma-54 factor
LHDKIKNILQRSGSYTRAHEQMLLSAIKDGRIGNYKHENYQRVKNDIKNALRFMQMMSISETPNNTVDLIAKLHNESIDIVVEDNIAEINLDAELQNEMKSKSRSSSDEKYISEKIKSAKLLLKSVNYRNSTMIRVAKEILYRQLAFFNNISAELSPLSVATIAGSLGLHESTVHRAIVNKTMSTSRGNFELKQLLAKEIQLADSSGAVSDFSVKQYIKQLIRQEPPDSPYSDSNLVYFLSTRGIVISRRTVAKYRESMNFPNYAQRLKNYKITEYK